MIVELKPYLSTKDSVIEWLGEEPSHWDVRSLKRIFRLEYGDFLATDSRLSSEIVVYRLNGAIGQHDKANTIAPCIVVGRKGSFGNMNCWYEAVLPIDTTFLIDGRFSYADMRWLCYLLLWLQLDSVTKNSAVPGLNREEAYQRVAPIPVKWNKLPSPDSWTTPPNVSNSESMARRSKSHC